MKKVTHIEYHQDGVKYSTTVDGHCPSTSECERQILFQHHKHVPAANVTYFERTSIAA